MAVVSGALVTRQSTVAVFLIGACAAWSCGGDGGSPVTPAPPAPPTANSITITSGVDALRSGFFADYTVTVSMSDRTTQTVTADAGWTSSDPAVATVDTRGRVTALSNGTISLNATYQGRAASRSVRVVHDYGGHWDGTFVARSCDETGVFISLRYCQNLGREPLLFALELTQSGPNVDQITGLMSLRGLVGPITGSIANDGRLTLRGPYVAAGSGGDVQVDILSWLTAPAGNLGMSGSFAYSLTLIGSDGKGTQSNEIVTALKKPGG